MLLADLEWDNLPEARYVALLAPTARPISLFSAPEEGVAFAVGPEGDWTDDEASVLLDNSFLPASLGPGILRSSTAAIVGCGWFRMSCKA
jgi:16S rRNA (uracil1498-N3)-methyltransferase